MADESKLQIILEAVNQTGNPFKELISTVQNLQTNLGEFQKTLSAAFQNVSNSASGSSVEIQQSIASDQTALSDLAKTASDETKATEESFASIAKVATDMEKTMSEVAAGVAKDMQEDSKAVNNFQKTASEDLQAAGKEMNTLRTNMEHGIGQIGGLIAIQQLGQSMEELGKKGEKLFDFAITQGEDFQQTMKNVQTVIAANITGHESWNDKLKDASGLTDQLQQKALDLGSRGAQSANEVGSAMDTMLRAGVDAKAILNGAAESAQNVAIVTGDKLDESANLVTEIYHQFRESFAENGKSMQENMKSTGDVLTGTLLSARINSQDFLDTLKYVGPVASQLGSNFLDTATATAVLAQNGIKGSQAGNNLKRALTSLLEPTKQGAQAMEHLGLIQNGHNKLIDESTGKMKNLTDIQKILHDSLQGLTEVQKAKYIHDMFGQYALAGTLVLANENSEAFSTLKDKIAGVSAENAAASMLDTFSGHMAQLKAHVQTTAKEFGMAFLPTLERLLPIGQKILSWFQELTPANKEFLMGFLAVGSAMAIAGGALATFAVSARFAGEGIEAIKGLSIISNAVPAFKAFALSVREVGFAEAFMNAMSPLGWIVLIGAVVAGAAMIIMQHWGSIKPWLENVWNEIKQTTLIVWNSIKDFFVQWGPAILSALTLGILPLVTLIVTHWDQIKSYTIQVWDGMLNGIRNLWTGFTTWVKDAVQSTMQGIVDAFSWLYDHNYYFKNLVDFIKIAWITIHDDVVLFWERIKVYLSGLWDGIKLDSEKVWNGISSFFSNVWTGITTAANTIWSPITSFFSGLWDGISGTASSLWGVIKATLSKLWNSTVTDGETIFDTLGTYFTGLWNEALQWGSNLVHMVAQGITNAVREVEQAASSVASSIAKFLGFHSPTETGPGADADTWAPNFVKMFAGGLAAGASQVGQAANTMIQPLSDAFSSFSGVNNSGDLEKIKAASQGIIEAKSIWTKASVKNDRTAMDHAHLMAEQYRVQLQKMGYDSSVFGADKTIPQTMSNMERITHLATQTISTKFRTMTTGLSTDLVKAKDDTDTNTNLMADIWSKNTDRISSSVTHFRTNLTESLQFVRELVKSVSEFIASTMEMAFSRIENRAVQTARTVVEAVNQIRAALVSIPSSGINASFSHTSSIGYSSVSSMPTMMSPVLSGGGVSIINHVVVHASGNVTESNHKLGEIVSEALLSKMKLQGKLG